MKENNHIFTKDCYIAYKSAFEFAQKKKFEYFTVDNFILFLSQTTKGRELFTALGLDFSDYEHATLEYLQHFVPKNSDNFDDNPHTTVALRKLIDFAYDDKSAQDTKLKEQIDESILFISLFHLDEEDSFTLYYFKKHKINNVAVINFFSHYKKKENEKKSLSPYLEKYTVNLLEQAKNNKSVHVGREKEIEQLIQILGRKKKNNPLLVGESGVGKSTIIDILLQKLLKGEIPSLKDYKILSLSMADLLAGAKYRGDFEERITNIIKEVSDKKIILVIEELHTFLTPQQGNNDTNSIMQQALVTGKFPVIGSINFKEYKKHIASNESFNRRFQKVIVEEPSVNDTFSILYNIRSEYENHHGVEYSEEALNSIIDLTNRYIIDRKLPDKAIDFLDIIGSKHHLMYEAQQDENLLKITSAHVKKIIAESLKIDINNFDVNQKTKLKTLNANIKSKIFGQEQAVDVVTNKILCHHSEIIKEDKLIGSFLFAGQTGTGKTELAKAVSEELNIPLVRFDMSEYMEKHAVARLIGAPPGYVGFDQGGLLIEAINKTPNCILLLDEIEKAHPDIMNILLQVMDYATLTENNGRKADFKNVILIITTNIGAQVITKNTIGFDRQQNIIDDRMKAIKSALTPEFINRLDDIVQFNTLSKEAVYQIISKQIFQIKKSIQEKKIDVNFSQEVIEYIFKNSFSSEYGARPIRKFIQQSVLKLLAQDILFEVIPQGSSVQVMLKDNELSYELVKPIELNILEKKTIAKKRRYHKKEQA